MKWLAIRAESERTFFMWNQIDRTIFSHNLKLFSRFLQFSVWKRTIKPQCCRHYGNLPSSSHQKNFFVKMCESEVPWFPHCENKRDHIQKFPWNQPFSNSFTKTVDLTEKMLIFFVKIVFLRLFTLLCEYFSISNHKFLSKLNSRNFSEQPINLFFVYTADG